MKYIQSANDIPGWTNVEQHRLYNNVVKQLPKKPKILEIGCGWGKSTWGWLDALPVGTEYYVLDIFFLNEHKAHLENLYNKALKYQKNKLAKYIKKSQNKNKTQYDMFLECVSQHDNFNYIKKIYKDDYFNWKKQNVIKFDMVYIDGDHSYEHVSDQLKYFKDVPIVCGDDYKEKSRDYFKGLMTAVDNYIKDNNKKSELFSNEHEGFYVIYNK